MLLKRRRLAVIASFLVLGCFFAYHRASSRGDGNSDKEKAWLKALKGDQNAFQVKLEGGLAGLMASDYPEMYPVQNLFELPKASEGIQTPRIQHQSESSGRMKGAQHERLDAVKEAFLHSWTNYQKFAWGKDELMPVTGNYRASFGDWAATLVDSMDTLWIMGLKKEFEQGVELIQTIDFSSPDALPINVFEVTIRYLGGLLGAYDVSDQRYPILLDKAKEVGNMLMGAFDTHNRLPVTYWNKKYGEEASTSSSIAELGSLSLEFTRLSQLTNDMRYYDAVTRISQCMASQQQHTRVPGLFPTQVDIRNCKFNHEYAFTLGGFADSAYEYLLKMHLLLNGSDPMYRDMHLATLEPISDILLQRPMTPDNLDILFPINHKAYPTKPETVSQMQHLSCFTGGMFALSARLFSREADLATARRLIEGCIWAYNGTASGIMPESFYFVPCPAPAPSSPSKHHNNNAQTLPSKNPPPPCKWNQTHYESSLWADHRHHTSPDGSSANIALPHLPYADQRAHVINTTTLPLGITAISSPTYRLRPEAIESIFILYRITGDAWLRDAAWDMFVAITKHTRAEFGFSSIRDVMLSSSSPAGTDTGGGGDEREQDEKHKANLLDRQETFWTAETLKYFWLIFSDEEVVSLDRWVFSTEAHPFRLGAL